MTTSEHIDWCINRARPYVVVNHSCAEAFANFVSDMKKHEQAVDNLRVLLDLGYQYALQSNESELVRWIIGFGTKSHEHYLMQMMANPDWSAKMEVEGARTPDYNHG